MTIKPQAQSYKWLGGLISALLILYTVYAGLLVHTSSFVVSGQRWFSLFDDAMISMRYAWNLAAGNGLVWNTGERVEGFTNPGWTFLMTLIHLVESRQNLTSLYVQVLSALCLAGTVVITAVTCLNIGNRSPIAACVAAAAVAFYYPLNFFSLMGMETGLLALVIAAATYQIIKCGEAGTTSRLGWLLMGFATIIRLDAVVPMAALAVAAWWVYPQNRKHMLASALAVVAVFLGSQTLARYLHYGEILPNTYYLKMEAPLSARLGRGVYMIGRFLYNHLWPFYVLTPLLIIIYLRRRQAVLEQFAQLKRSPLLIPVALVAGQIAYSIYVGGDVWEQEFFASRFMVIVIPAFFILVSQAFVALIQKSVILRDSMASRPVLWSVSLSILLVIQSNNHASHRVAWEEATFQRPLPYPDQAADFVVLAKHLKQNYPADITIAIDRAGTLPYLMPHRTFYDVLGKMDPVIARTPSRLQDDQSVTTAFVPGHTKWDASHTIGRLKPDVLVLTADFLKNDYEPWIDQTYKKSTRGFPEVYYRR